MKFRFVFAILIPIALLASIPALAQAPLVKRRRSIAILQAATPIANGRQCLLEEARAARPMRNPAPTAIRGPWVD